MIAYEQKLRSDVNWAFHEAGSHFENRSAVHTSLRRITQRLHDLGIPYGILGSMAMFAHGFRRFTQDIDVLVSAHGFKAVTEQLDGVGYIPALPQGQRLRDIETGVLIEFLVTGQFPGDGKPKPVAFPDPARSSIDIGGISYLQLLRLIELRLASGMTNRRRLKDLADVQELI